MDPLDQVTERIKIPLTEREYRALCAVAQRELRPVPMQAQHIIMEALRRERLLPPAADIRKQSEVVSS